MKIIGCDFHPSYQQIAMTDTETGEMVERALLHEAGEAKTFYEGLKGEEVMVGIEATGALGWFEALLTKLGHGYMIGDAAQIRSMAPRKQKNDRRDAELLMKLLAQNRFPRIWVPTPAMRDQRQLVMHRHKMVKIRRQVKNQLQGMALNQGLQRKHKLWTLKGRAELAALPLEAWANRRRADLTRMLDELDVQVDHLDHAVEHAGQSWDEVELLMTHPGVGPVTALAMVLTLGPVERFARGKQVASYLGLIPREYSSGGRGQKLGGITKQGNRLMRSLLIEAGHSAIRGDEELRREYKRLAHKKPHRGVAKVAIARKLAVRLYWMLRTRKTYAQCFGSYVGQPESSRGGQKSRRSLE